MRTIVRTLAWGTVIGAWIGLGLFIGTATLIDAVLDCEEGRTLKK